MAEITREMVAAMSLNDLCSLIEDWADLTDMPIMLGIADRLRATEGANPVECTECGWAGDAAALTGDGGDCPNGCPGTAVMGAQAPEREVA